MNNPLHMYLDTSVVRIRQRAGAPWRRSVTELYTGPVDDAGAAFGSGTSGAGLAGFRRWRPRRDLHLHLAGSHCRFMVVSLPASLRDDGERLAAAGAQMAHQLGLDGNEWTVALDGAGGSGKVIACALRRDTLALVQRLAQACGARLASARPFPITVWNLCVNAARQASGSLVVVEDDAFTVFFAADGRVETITTLRHAQEPSLIDAELRRLALGCSAGTPAPRLVMPVRLGTMAPATAIRPETLDVPVTRLHTDFRDLVLRPGGEEAA